MRANDAVDEMRLLLRREGRRVKTLGEKLGELEAVGTNGRTLYLRAEPAGEGVVKVSWEAFENDGGTVRLTESRTTTDEPWWKKDVQKAVRAVLGSEKETDMETMRTRRGSETAVAAAMGEDADKDYKVARKEVDRILADVERGLKGHDARQTKSPMDWGYVGDMGYVKEHLQNIVRFLGK